MDAIVGNSGTGPHASPYDATIGSHFKQTDYEATTPDGQITDFYGNGSHYNFRVGDRFNDDSVYITDASNTDDVALYRIENGKFYEGTTVNSAKEVTWSASVLGTEVDEVRNVVDPKDGKGTWFSREAEK